MLTFECQTVPDKKWGWCRSPSEEAARIASNSIEGCDFAFAPDQTGR